LLLKSYSVTSADDLLIFSETYSYKG